MAPRQASKVRWVRLGVVSRPIKSSETNGDAYLFVEWKRQTLMTVIDGLGHGGEAYMASQKAREYVEDHASEDLEEIIRGCDRHIRKTRGVAIGLVRIDRNTSRFSCCGIGNVETRILNKWSRHPIPTAGIVGYNVRKIRRFDYPYDPVGVVIIHSDGVLGRFDPSKYPHLRRDPQRVAEQIIDRLGKETDDATILIAVETR